MTVEQVPPFDPVNQENRVNTQVTRLQPNFDRAQNTLEALRVAVNCIIDQGVGANLPDIITAGEREFPASITVDARGIITAITAGSEPIPLSQRGQPNGVATLDGAARVPLSQIPLGVFEFLGLWDADTNTPTLASSTGTSGQVYIVSVAGTTNLDGETGWQLGDFVVFTPAGVWARIARIDQVTSVNGQIGVVQLGAGDLEDSTLAELNSVITDATLDDVSGLRPGIVDRFALSTSISLTNADHASHVLVDSSGNDVTVTVPTTLPDGFYCYIRKAGNGTITVSPAAGITIQGPTALTDGDFALLVKIGATEFSVEMLRGSGTATDVDAVDVSLNTAAFDGNLNSGITNVQLFADAYDNLDTAVLRRASILTFTDSFDITADNISGFVNREHINVRTTNAILTVRLPPSGLTTDSSGNPISYPLFFRFFNDGGTSTFSSTNRLEISAVGSDRIERASGTQLVFQSVSLGEGVDVRLDSATSTTWRVFPFGSTNPRDVGVSDGDFVFQNRSVSLNSDGSFNIFAATLAGITPQRGFAYVVSGARDDEFTQYFNTVVHGGDVLVASIDNPSTAFSSQDWIVLRSGDNFPVTLPELRFLDQVTEADTVIRGAQIDGSGLNNIQFWLSTDPFVAAPFITPSTDPNNPRSGHSGPYVGEQDSFDEPTNFFGHLLYVGLGLTYLSSRNLATSDVQIEIADNLGTVHTTYNLGTDFIERSELNNSTYRYYALQTSGLIDSYSLINYRANYTIRGYILNTERRFTTSALYDAVSSIADNAVVEAKLSEVVRAKLNRGNALDPLDQTKLDNILPQTTEVTADGSLQLGYHEGDPSSTLSDYLFGSLSAFSLIGVDHPTHVVLIFDHEHRLDRIEEDGTPANTISFTEVDPSLIAEHRMYTFTVPENTSQNLVTWTPVIVQDQVTELDFGDLYVVDSENLSPALIARIDRSAPEAAIPAPLPQLAQDLSVTSRTITGWRTVSPSPIPAQLERIGAAFWDEDRRTFSPVNGNYFEDVSGLFVDTGAANTLFFYGDPNDPLNFSFPGAQSYSLNSRVFLRNATAGQQAPIDPANFNLIVAFDFALQRELEASDEQDILRMGPGIEPIIEYDGENEGLVVRVGRQDGGQRTRDIDIRLDVADAHLGTQVGTSTAGESEIIVPPSGTGDAPVFPLVVTIAINLLLEGTDEGPRTYDYTITDENTDQSTVDTRTFAWATSVGPISIEVDITYDANNVDTGTSRNVIFVRPTSPLSNAGEVFNVTATYTHTDTWNAPATFADFPINAGNSHDRFGLFNPSLYDTEQVQRLNSVICMFYKRFESDTSANPEMALRVITDGEEYPEILLHRNASECGFLQTGIADWGMRLGNSITAMTHLQAYYYDTNGVDRHVPTIADLHTLYEARARWLGAFRNSDEETDDWTLNGNLIIQPPDEAADIDIGSKLAASHATVQRVEIVTSQTVTASQSVTFATNPADSQPWALGDFDEIFIEFDVGGSREAHYTSSLAGTGIAVGNTSVELQNTAIIFGDAGDVITVVGVSYRQ